MKVEKIIYRGKSELSEKLGVSVENLEFVGMQSLTSGNSFYVPIFNVIDKTSNFYMSTRSGFTLYAYDELFDRYLQV